MIFLDQGIDTVLYISPTAWAYTLFRQVCTERYNLIGKVFGKRRAEH